MLLDLACMVAGSAAVGRIEKVDQEDIRWAKEMSSPARYLY